MPRRLQTYETDAITVTFDPTRCIHAAECVRGLPRVFRPKERRWIQLEHGDTEAIVEVVERCPTGALQSRRPRHGDDVAAAETTNMREAQTLVVRLARDGPLYLRGDVAVVTESGVPLGDGTRIALCRCGGSQNAPYCDGSHRERGFRAPDPRPPQDPTIP